jgi:hypothetical protein
MSSEAQLLWDVIDRLLGRGLSDEMVDVLLLAQEILEQKGSVDEAQHMLGSFLHDL